MLRIVLSMALFTSIVLLLSMIVLTARHWLLPRGLMTVNLNGRQNLSVGAGERLLWALAARGVYLPAACGGRGTCGQCRITVTSGATAPLPVEATHIGRRDARDGVRLACMTTVRQNLSIVVADDLLEARKWNCRVVSNRSVSPFLKELTLSLQEGQRMPFEAGDYVLLEAPAHELKFADFEIDAEFRNAWDRYGLFKLQSIAGEPVVRAYSLANAPSDDARLTLLVRIALPPANAPADAPPGKASSYVFSLKTDDFVTVSGPFGDFHAQESDREMVFIAGGVGIAPIRSIILDRIQSGTKRKMSLWYGARNALELCYKDEFEELARRFENFDYHVALSEPRDKSAWTGFSGLIHAVLREQYLLDHPAPEEVEYYLCGPPLMSAAVMHMLEDLGVEPGNIFFDDFGT